MPKLFFLLFSIIIVYFFVTKYLIPALYSIKDGPELTLRERKRHAEEVLQEYKDEMSDLDKEAKRQKSEAQKTLKDVEKFKSKQKIIKKL